MGSNFWMWRPTDSLQAKKQTRFKLIRNDKYLFILIESDTDGKNFNTPNLKRDFSTYPTDYLTLLFDTFNDGTNAFSFATNPIGLKLMVLFLEESKLSYRQKLCMGY